jgi:hypothetical protein
MFTRQKQNKCIVKPAFTFITGKTLHWETNLRKIPKVVQFILSSLRNAVFNLNLTLNLLYYLYVIYITQCTYITGQ